jgi:hypothetical protein
MYKAADSVFGTLRLELVIDVVFSTSRFERPLATSRMTVYSLKKQGCNYKYNALASRQYIKLPIPYRLGKPVFNIFGVPIRPGD